MLDMLHWLLIINLLCRSNQLSFIFKLIWLCNQTVKYFDGILATLEIHLHRHLFNDGRKAYVAKLETTPVVNGQSLQKLYFFTTLFGIYSRYLVTISY